MNKTTHYQKVHDFMDGAKQLPQNKFLIPPKEERILRSKLILEEAMEQVEGLGVSLMYNHDDCHPYFLTEDVISFKDNGDYDAQKVLDAFCDINVINTGTAITCKFSEILLDKSQEAVDNNNLSKLDGPDGPIFREDGKLLKPDGYVSVDKELNQIMDQYYVGI